MSNQNLYNKHKHLIGTTINNWTILDIVIYEERQHAYALAKCKCGTIKEVRLTYIVNNRTLDCGCEFQKRLNNTIIKKYKHLLHTTINGWTILDIIPPNGKKRKTHMLCQCKCGTIKEVNLSYLLDGRSKDCGCGRKNTISKIRTNNLVGQKFGKLTVVDMLERRNKNGRIVYKCRCVCGNEINVLGNSLTTHHTSSCGCLISYWNMYIQQFLKDNKIPFKSEYTVNIDDKYYRFDFYLPQYNLFIEYDGQQHYEPVRFHGDNYELAIADLKKNQMHDEIKNKYCEENNINLLRIPYWETKNIEIIINNCLQRLSEKGFIENDSMKYATV